MIPIPKTWEQWAKALLASVVSSVATAILSGLGVTVQNALGAKVQALDWNQLGSLCASSALVGACLYLKQSPMPKDPNGNGSGLASSVHVFWVLILLSFFLTGCTTAIKQGNIIHVTTRMLGIRVVTASQGTSTPEIDFGFSSSTVSFIPTSTNLLNAPRFMSAFDTKSTANPFDTSIRENIGAGDVYLGGTNDTSKAIIPGQFSWPPGSTTAAPATAAAPQLNNAAAPLPLTPSAAPGASGAKAVSLMPAAGSPSPDTPLIRSNGLPLFMPLPPPSSLPRLTFTNVNDLVTGGSGLQVMVIPPSPPTNAPATTNAPGAK